MSEENVDIVRRGYEHWSRTGELLWELIDPEVEVHDPPIGPDSKVRHGHEGLRASFASVEESFDDLGFETEEIYDAGDDVVVFVRMHGRGKGSGIELEVPVAHLCTLRGGRLVRIRVLARDEAMEAAGLGAGPG
jgi:ketosteroid isomerase-like protein